MRTYFHSKTIRFQNIFTSKIIILKIINSASEYLGHVSEFTSFQNSSFHENHLWKHSLKKILIWTYLNFSRLTVHRHQCIQLQFKTFVGFIDQIFPCQNSVYYLRFISTIYISLVSCFSVLIPHKSHFENQGGTKLLVTPLLIASLVLVTYMMQTCSEYASDPILLTEVKSTVIGLQPRVRNMEISYFPSSPPGHHLMTTENASYQLLPPMKITNIVVRGNYQV